MAAITPHLEGAQEMDPLDAQYQDCAAGKGGLTGLGEVYGCPLPGEVIAVNHSQLSNLAYNRSIAVEALADRNVELVKTPKGFRLVLDKPIPYDTLPWSLMANERSFKGVSLLSWTSKMQTPSFSLPAGANQMGGACPGAQAGQSTVPQGAREKQEKVVLKVLNSGGLGMTEEVQQVDLAAAVCEHCYATGGNYAYADIMLGSMLRFAWTRYAVSQGFFTEVMIPAIASAEYRDAEQPAHWAETGWRFFRIHDSGDFYDERYFRAWKEIADAFAPQNVGALGVRPVMFWAPTRMWAVPGWVDLVDKVNGGANNLGNFIIRPSAYELNQHAPELRKPNGGWGPASTVVSPEVANRIRNCELPPQDVIFDWDCRAYEVKDGPNCRGSGSPLGVDGCRACWMSPGVVNYQAH